MPNYCENDLYVTGPEEQINKFLEKGFTASAYVPKPNIELLIKEFQSIPPYEQKKWINGPNTELADAAEHYWFNNGGYWWCVNNWGTKWDWEVISTQDYKKTGKKLTFDTAWSPPLPVVIAASKEFPLIRFTLKYFEAGMGFCGTFSCKNGETIKDETRNNYRGKRGG